MNKNIFSKIKLYIVAHKIISGVLLVVVLYGGYWGYKKATATTGEVRYVEAAATTGTIISSITGTGQVAALNQVDIKPTVSGTLTYVGVKAGDEVGSGQTLFSIDDTDAQKTVRDAELSLQTSQIALNKLQLSNSTDDLNATLAQSYEDGFNNVSDAFLDLPGIMNGLNDIFYKNTNGTTQLNIDWYAAEAGGDQEDQATMYKQDFIDSYTAATTAFNDNFSKYQSTSRTSDTDTIGALITQTYNTTKLISDAIKDANNYIDFVNDAIKNRDSTPPAIIATHIASLNSYTSEINSHLASLESTQTDIKNGEDAFPNANLDLQSEQLDITQKQNALQDAKDQLVNYTVRAPFSGTIASVPVEKGDDVSSGTVLGTVITSQQIATISLNEVDIAKIQLGEKATLTFDAVPDLTITGKVAEIDSIGTVSQGVVNYSVEITFDTNDSQIKPGMSVSAAIITAIKQDVITVPNSAIKTQNGTSYVQMFNTPLLAPLPGVQGSTSLVPPQNQPVVIGVADDTMTEIVSGLKEGDEVVTRTIAPTTTTTAAAPSILGATGGAARGGFAGGGAGGARPTGR